MGGSITDHWRDMQRCKRQDWSRSALEVPWAASDEVKPTMVRRYVVTSNSVHYADFPRGKEHGLYFPSLQSGNHGVT